MLAAERDALVTALIARHEDALPLLDGDWSRGYDLGRRALALASLGRWGEAEHALERAAALDEEQGRGAGAARFALEAAVAGQGERAQRWIERVVTSGDDDEDDVALTLACQAVVQARLGREDLADEAWQRLREAPRAGYFGCVAVMGVLAHAARDEEVVHHLAAFVAEAPAFQVEEPLVSVVHGWIERHGEETARVRLERVLGGNEGLQADRLVSLAHLARGDGAAALEGLRWLDRSEQGRLWGLLSGDERPAMLAALAARGEELHRGGHLPAALSAAGDLAHLAPDAARPLVARLISPRSTRASRSLLGKKVPSHLLHPLALAAERCGLETGPVLAAARTDADRLQVALGRLEVHRAGEAAWAGLRDEALAASAALPPGDPGTWRLLMLLERQGDSGAALALGRRLEAAAGSEPASDLPWGLALQVRWRASEPEGRAAPPDLLERVPAVATVAALLVHQGYEARVLPFVDWVSEGERSNAVVLALEALARPIGRRSV